MSESIYLILGTAEDKKRSSVILNEVSNAIYTVGITNKRNHVRYAYHLTPNRQDITWRSQ